MEDGSVVIEKTHYKCGGCLFICTTILDLHFHVTEHIEGGNYFYDNTLKIAYPKYRTTDTDCQTVELTPLLVNNIKQEFVEPAESTGTISTATQTELFKLNIVKIAIENSGPNNEHTSSRGCSLKFVKQQEEITAFPKQSEGFKTFDNGTIQPEENYNDFSCEQTFVDPATSNEDGIAYDEDIVKVEDISGDTRLVSVRKRRHSHKGKGAYKLGKQKVNRRKGMTKERNTKSEIFSKHVDIVKSEQKSFLRETVSPKEEFGGSDDELYRSFLENTSVEEKKCYLCTVCNEQIKTRQAWENHIELLHYRRYMSQCTQCYYPFHEDDEVLLHNCTLVAVDSHDCLQCPDKKSFKFRSNLLRHIEEDHEKKFPLACDRCEVPLISELEQRKHMPKHDPSLLKCAYCQKQLKTVTDLDSHLPNHTGETKFHCHLCEKKYRKKAYLRDHIFRTHGNDIKQYTCICEKCGSSFAHSKLLYDHRRSSCGEPIYECSQCDKKFCQKTSLKYHIRNHSGERPFICDMCGDTFTHSHTLKNHVKHKHTNDRQFKCSMCDKAFVKICTLQRHERVHLKIRLHACEYCKKEFSTNWNLKAHMRQHTGDTPYVCSVCGLGFAHNVVRKTHEAKCSGNNS